MRPAATAKELAANLAQVYEAVFNVSLDRYDVDGARQVGARADARNLRPAPRAARSGGRLAAARVHVASRADCAVRNALRVARYATDMLGELNIRYAQLATRRGDACAAFAATTLNTLVNPAFDTGEDLPFQSGDLLLMRGMHHNSAAIARIGDVNSQFSHIAIIHTDENGKQWVVESLIEEGAIINPLDAVLHHGLGRCVVFRHKDPDARRAALPR